MKTILRAILSTMDHERRIELVRKRYTPGAKLTPEEARELRRLHVNAAAQQRETAYRTRAHVGPAKKAIGGTMLKELGRTQRKEGNIPYRLPKAGAQQRGAAPPSLALVPPADPVVEYGVYVDGCVVRAL